LLLRLVAPAGAEAPVCTGTDLIAELRDSDPGGFAALRAEAQAIANNRGLFWKIEPANGAAPSYLLGTVHVTDPRVHALSGPVRAALDKAATKRMSNTGPICWP
jgi:uncharacterized protein YbaP (TraB family)